MLYNTIRLSSPAYPEKEDVYLECFVAEPLPEYTRPAILVIPGGGYGSVCFDREGEPIALAFVSRGFNAFVLHYSVNRSRSFPAQLCEASMAMAHIRENATSYGIDPNKIFVAGFSAGGHLAASLGIMWHREEVVEGAGIKSGENKPAGMILCYPVISANPTICHANSFFNLLGTDTPSAAALESVSMEKHVDENSVPLFLMHTANDSLVDVRNSLVLGEAYRHACKPFELHIYPDAPHGVALGNEVTWIGNEKYVEPAIEKWVEDAVYWAKHMALKL